MSRDEMAGDLLDEAWGVLTGGEDVARPPIDVDGSWGLPSHLATAEVAEASVALALASAAALAPGPVGELALHREHVTAAVRSERFFRIDGQPAGMGFAPLSRFWRARDGWLRTHANYPWHRRALLDALGLDEPDPDRVAAAIAERTADDVEASVFAAGGIAGATRTADDWAAHPQGAAVAAVPLIDHRARGDAPARRPAPGARPAEGVRVLDLTRVIAGPVCTRYLAALGADVLRLDPSAFPDLTRGEPNDTLLGKASAVLDLDQPGNEALLHELLDEADVVVRGYRPGALDRFGLGEDDLAARHPGLVVVSLAAWGHDGPWAGRRGFDSIVQSVVGIAEAERPDGTADAEPGVLPCQLLDHGTGYLAAAAALDGLRRQRATGGTHLRRVSLARTAAWLLSRGRQEEVPDQAPDHGERWVADLDAVDTQIQAVRPPGRFGPTDLTWPTPAVGYGTSAPSFTR